MGRDPGTHRDTPVVYLQPTCERARPVDVTRLHVCSFCTCGAPQTQMVTPSFLRRETEARVWQEAHRWTSTSSTANVYQMSVGRQSLGMHKDPCVLTKTPRLALVGAGDTTHWTLRLGKG